MQQNRHLNVLMMPDYRHDNPYQKLLANALGEADVSVNFCEGYRRVLPIFRQIKMSSHGVDVLHLHWLNTYLKGDNWFVKICYCLKFLLDVVLVKSLGTRIIWTIHNLEAHNTAFPRIEKWLKQNFLSLTNQAIVHSQAAKELVLQRYRVDAAKIAVIPHGHYRDVYPKAIAQDTARQKLGLPEAGLIFLNFGMLKPYKGVDKLLALWHSKDNQLQDSYLLIVGKALDDRYGETLLEQSKKIALAELRNQFIADEELHLYFSAADVVVLPFQQILTSGSLLLAMSYGKPVIAPKFPSIEETLAGATDFLYDANQADGLLHSVQRCMKTDLAFVSNKVETICQHLNWSAIAQKTRKIYQP